MALPKPQLNGDVLDYDEIQTDEINSIPVQGAGIYGEYRYVANGLYHRPFDGGLYPDNGLSVMEWAAYNQAGVSILNSGRFIIARKNGVASVVSNQRANTTNNIAPSITSGGIIQVYMNAGQDVFLMATLITNKK